MTVLIIFQLSISFHSLMNISLKNKKHKGKLYRGNFTLKYGLYATQNR